MKWANEFSATSEFPTAHNDNLQILVGQLHYVSPPTQRDNTVKHKISNNNIKTKTFFFPIMTWLLPIWSFLEGL